MLATQIDAAMTTRGWSNEDLARKSGYTEGAIRKIIRGESTRTRTCAEVCEALDLDFGQLLRGFDLGRPDGVAPVELGGYTKEHARRYVGKYVTIRPKYGDPTLVKAYSTAIFWDDQRDHLRFKEQDRLDDDYAHEGDVHIDEASSCLYLLTLRNGWVRTVIVSKPVANGQQMRGLIASQFNIMGGAFGPVCAPIAYLRINGKTELAFGEFNDTHDSHGRYFKILQTIVRDTHARFALPPPFALDTGPRGSQG